MNNFNILIFLGLFFAYLIFDVLYVKYILYVSKLHAFKVANISAMMYIITTVSTLIYVNNFIYIFSIIAGAWLGSFVSIKIEIKQKNKRVAAAKAAKLKKKII